MNRREALTISEAATLLVGERHASLIGVDTASVDIGASRDFLVHRIIGAANVPGLENLTNLEELPATGVTLMASDLWPKRLELLQAPLEPVRV